MRPRLLVNLTLVSLLAVQCASFAPNLGTRAADAIVKKPVSVSEVMTTVGDRARVKLKTAFKGANVQYPPSSTTWVALKEEKVLYVFAPDRSGKMRSVLTFPIIGASGVAGPKLREGDKQVPEGFYKLVRFRPNLVAYMGLELNYPNAEDRAQAKAEHRRNLGGDILIHGSRWSTGCLAMENDPIEQLFVLAHDTGLSKVDLIFAPCDLTRTKPKVNYASQPPWLPKLYDRLRNRIRVILPPNTITSVGI